MFTKVTLTRATVVIDNALVVKASAEERRIRSYFSNNDIDMKASNKEKEAYKRVVSCHDIANDDMSETFIRQHLYLF